MGGCCLGGVLSVICFIPGAAVVVHAPEGCVHQTFSILHAVTQDLEKVPDPEIIVSGLSDRDVIFGGEECLAAALDKAAGKNPDCIIAVTSCVPETIGDDCRAVCDRHPWPGNILYIPASGFLGGTSKDGENMALMAVASLACVQEPVKGTVAVIGEKNLESEADENYAEAARLLARLGLTVAVRFCRNATVSELQRLGSCECFILRDARSSAAGAFLAEKFSRPLIPEFPRGLSGCIRFLREAGYACGISEATVLQAVAAEEAYQAAMLAKFPEFAGRKLYLGAELFEGTAAVTREAMERLSMTESPDGYPVRLPFYLPVGTAGVEKMLYLWRRALRNA